MKILFLNHNYKQEGTYFRAFHFAKNLAAMGHEATLMTLSPKNWIFPKKYSEAGVSIIETPRLLDVDGGGWAPLDVLYRTLHACMNRYDLIYGFDHKPNVFYPMLAGRKTHKGTVLFSDWADWWTKGGMAEGARFKPESFFETFMEESIRLKSDYVICISKALRQRALSIGVPAERAIYMPSGADIEGIKPATKATLKIIRKKYSLPFSKKVLMFIGFGQADLGIMLDGFNLLRKKRNDVFFAVVGPLDKKLKGAFDSSPYKEDIVVTGKVDYNTVAEYASAADLFLLPLSDRSINLGRWPNKIGDYMAAGKPVVLNPVGDMKELVEKYKIGLSAGYDPADIAKKADRILRSAKLSREMGNNSRKTAEKLLDWKKKARDIEKFFNIVKKENG